MNGEQLDHIEETARVNNLGYWFPAGVLRRESSGLISAQAAEYIEAMSPTTALALVARVRELETRLAAVDEVVHLIDTSAGGSVEYCHPQTREWRSAPVDLLIALGEEL